MHYSPNLLLYAYFKYLIIAWLIIGASSVEEQTREESVNCSMQLFTDCSWKCVAAAICQPSSAVCSHCFMEQQWKLWEIGKNSPRDQSHPINFEVHRTLQRTEKPTWGGWKHITAVIYWRQELGGEKAENLLDPLLIPSLLEFLHLGHPRNLMETNFSCILHWRCTEPHLNWIWKRSRRLVAKSQGESWEQGSFMKQNSESFWASHK